MVLEIQARGSESLRRMADALRKADREDLRRGLDRAIRRAAQPTLRDIQESAKSIKTRGQRKPGAKRPFRGSVRPHNTRAQIADAVAATVSTAGEDPRVRFQVRESQLPEVLRGMPRKFDSGKWRHPVMGNRDVWVGQTADPWFFPPIRKNLDTFRAAIDAELDKVRANLEAS